MATSTLNNTHKQCSGVVGVVGVGRGGVRMELICCDFARRFSLSGKRVCKEDKREAIHVSSSILPERKERRRHHQIIFCIDTLDQCSHEVFSFRSVYAASS